MGFRSRLISISVLVMIMAFFIMGIAISSNAQIKRTEPGESARLQPSKELQKRSGIYETGKIEQLKLDYPEFYENLPETLLIGDFTLYIASYSNRGTWNFADNQAEGVSGTAWISFDCSSGVSISPIWPGGYIGVIKEFEVVDSVDNPEAEISLEDAHLLKKDAKLGESMKLKLGVSSRSQGNILMAKSELIEKLRKESSATTAIIPSDSIVDVVKPLEKKGDIKVSFENVTIRQVAKTRELKRIAPSRMEIDKEKLELPMEEGVGRITEGTAIYPTDPPDPEIIELAIEGFTALIDILTITPTGATANINLQLPGSIGSADTCDPATLHLGTIGITPYCEFYAERSDEAFGYWILGDTGLIVNGTGYIVDFSSSQSPPSKSASWKGLILQSGTASGTGAIPVESNTGYLATDYSFTSAEVIKTGFAGQLDTSESHTFNPVYPFGYVVTMGGATLSISESAIASGELKNGRVVVPKVAIQKAGGSGGEVEATFSKLTVRSNMDVDGDVSFGSLTMAWGELTHSGNEEVAWNLNIQQGYLYLPAGPVATFSPDIGGGFYDLPLPASLTDLQAQGIAGIVLDNHMKAQNMSDIVIYTPDRPGGKSNPIKMANTQGWLRIGSRGLDGELNIRQYGIKQEIGDDARDGYVGNQPFDATLNASDKDIMQIQYATSAVYDSSINGTINIPEPCNIKDLPFSDMELTSMANLVGGDLTIPGGTELEYWKLGFESTSSQAGVVSARTGRLVFTAAGISEYVHFDKAFSLIWCEMLADGNIGELFINHSSYGQQFDGLDFSQHNLVLSKYDSGCGSPCDGAYLAVCGTVHFDFFGSNFVNIKDAYYASSDPASYQNRYVTVPNTGDASDEETDLHLHGEWNDELAVLDFPDANMEYNETAQIGFIGEGTGGLSFIHSNGFTTTITIHEDSIDICLYATGDHEIDFGAGILFSSLTHTTELFGCIRIEGPQLERICIGGYLEQATQVGRGILAAEQNSLVEATLTITPNSCTFYVYGDLLLTVAAAASAVEVSGAATLTVDFIQQSAEGDIQAVIDCSTISLDLKAEGQLTWYVDPYTQYFQGRVGIELCSWTGSAGIEGGIFIGHNVDKGDAWVLTSTGSERFGVSQDILPDTLTGVYGYGLVSFSVQYYVFGGGIELFAGVGAFVEAPDDVESISDSLSPGLPYVVGSAGIYVTGEILGGLVSASGWADLDMLIGPYYIYYEGKFGLEACVLWVFCGSVEIRAGLSQGGFYMEEI